jgi:hypothetical protein
MESLGRSIPTVEVGAGGKRRGTSTIATNTTSTGLGSAAMVGMGGGEERQGRVGEGSLVTEVREDTIGRASTPLQHRHAISIDLTGGE